MKMQLYVVADTGTEVISSMNIEVDFKIADTREFYKLVMKLRRLKRRAIYLRKYRRRGERMSRHG